MRLPHKGRTCAPGGCRVQGGVGAGEPHAHLALVAAPALLRVLALRVVPAHRQCVVAAACDLRTPPCGLMHTPSRAGCEPTTAGVCMRHMCRHLCKQGISSPSR